MIRSSRLMATMLAAVFAAVLATPAYATYTSTCGSASARTYTTTSCKAEGTKFNDLDADGKRDSGEPGLANWRIWADFDNDGVLDIRRAVRRHRRERPLRDRRHQADEQQQDAHVHDPQDLPPARAAPGRRDRRLDVLVPERLDLRWLRQRHGRRLQVWPRADRRQHGPEGHRQGLRQLQEAQDHRDQEARPRHGSGPLRPQGRRRDDQGGSRRRRQREHLRHGRRAPGHGDRGERHRPRRLHGLDQLQDHHGRAHVRPGLGPRQAGRRRHLHDHEHPQGQGRDRQADRACRDGRHLLRLHRLRRRLQPHARRA